MDLRRSALVKTFNLLAKNFLDKIKKVWYNIITVKEREVKKNEKVL